MISQYTIINIMANPKFFCRSNITSTQEQALDRIIELGIADDHIRELLEESALNTITSFREDPLVWYALDPSLQKRAQKAITALSDSRIRYLVEGALANREHMFDGIFSELVAYLLYVSSCPTRGPSILLRLPATQITPFLSFAISAFKYFGTAIRHLTYILSSYNIWTSSTTIRFLSWRNFLNGRNSTRL